MPHSVLSLTNCQDDNEDSFLKAIRRHPGCRHEQLQRYIFQHGRPLQIFQKWENLFTSLPIFVCRPIFHFSWLSNFSPPFSSNAVSISDWGLEPNGGGLAYW